MTDVRPQGVNLVGYHHVTSGLGAAVREIDRSFTAAGVDVRRVDVTATNSPVRRDAGSIPSDLHPTTVAVVTAAQLPHVWSGLVTVRSATRRLIGVWFWELSTFPDSHRPAIELVDEIWAPTTFIHDAYERCGRPLHRAPLRLREPRFSAAASTRWRHDIRLGSGDFLFLASFDLFSVIQRKNPLGVIEGFVRAFGNEPDRAVRLVLKVLNGENLPDDLETIRRAAAIDSRIAVIDEHLDDDAHQALISLADCFVSLHRSEGLGLQLAEAMWSGTVVLATRYGGNLDFMDDSCAALVDATLAPVGDGRGAYPDDAQWAEPNLEQAGDWMRRLVEHPHLGEHLAANAHQRMREQRSDQEFGQLYRQLLGWSAVPR
jgi:glycosyltransferase involved in cell wall biosynthesis